MAATLPSFLVIGAQKAATTTVWSHLRRHPALFLPESKELNFFLEEGNWPRGMDWYRDQFATAPPGTLTGEASPGYTMWPIFSGVPERVAQHLPEVRLVYVVREPIARMEASWRQGRRDATEQRGLGQSLLLDTRYLALSSYATQLEQYLDCFDREQVLVVKSEDLARFPRPVMERIVAFIGADPDQLPPLDDARHNVSAGRTVPTRPTLAVAAALRRIQARRLALRLLHTDRPVLQRSLRHDEQCAPARLRSLLERWLRPEMVRLEAIVGDGFDAWGLGEAYRYSPSRPAGR